MAPSPHTHYYSHSGSSTPSTLSHMRQGSSYTPSLLGLSGLPDTLLNGPDSPSLPAFDISTASLEYLLQNPHVHSLFSQVVSMSKAITSLANENMALRSGSTDHQGRVAFSSGSLDTLALGISNPRNIQVSSIRSSVRPPGLPFEVLWNLADCNKDPNAAPTESNQSRPSMAQALRNEDGTMLNAETFDNICSDVASACLANLNTLPPPPQAPPSVRNGPRSKTWYTTYYPKEFLAVANQLEEMHSVLTLCGGHWKAEHMMMAHLNAKTNTLKRNSKGRGARSRATGKGDPDVEMVESEKEKTTEKKKRRRTSSASGPRSPHEKRPRGNKLDKDGESILQATFGVEGGGSKPPSRISSLPLPQRTATEHAKGPKDRPEEEPLHVVNVGFIEVSASTGNLQGIFTTEFSTILHASELLAALEELEKTQPCLEPNDNVAKLLENVETADPNAPGLSKDEMNSGWGHRQFRAGGMSAASILASWEAVGNVEIARRLLAAAIKTCRVARHLCHKRKIHATSYTADAFLDIVVERLWNIVEPLKIPKDKDDDSQPSIEPSADPTVQARLQGLQVAELKMWAQKNGIQFSHGSNVRKTDLVKAILSSGIVPTEDDAQTLSSDRSTKRKKPPAK